MSVVYSFPSGSGRWFAGWRQQMRMGRGKAEGEVWLTHRENIYFVVVVPHKNYAELTTNTAFSAAIFAIFPFEGESCLL